MMNYIGGYMETNAYNVEKWIAINRDDLEPRKNT